MNISIFFENRRAEILFVKFFTNNRCPQRLTKDIDFFESRADFLNEISDFSTTNCIRNLKIHVISLKNYPTNLFNQA